MIFNFWLLVDAQSVADFLLLGMHFFIVDCWKYFLISLDDWSLSIHDKKIKWKIMVGWMIDYWSITGSKHPAVRRRQRDQIISPFLLISALLEYHTPPEVSIIFPNPGISAGSQKFRYLSFCYPSMVLFGYSKELFRVIHFTVLKFLDLRQNPTSELPYARCFILGFPPISGLWLR